MSQQETNNKTFESFVNNIYDGQTSLPDPQPYPLSGETPNPHQVEARITGKTPGPLPSKSPKGDPKKFDADAHLQAVRNYLSAGTISNEDTNDWGKAYTYNAGYQGFFFDRYNKIEDRPNGVYFHPDLASNEETYSANTNFAGDVYRTMRYSAFPQWWNGVKSNYANITSTITADFGPSTRLARDYSYNTALTYSSKNNLGSFVNNLLNNFSYTLGIMSTAIAENYFGAMLGASTTVGRNASNLALRNLKAGKPVDGLRTYTQMLEDTADINKLRQMHLESQPKTWQKFFESGAVRTFNPLSNLTDNYYGILNQTDDFSGYMATYNNFAKTVGAAYRDFRNINLALSESKLEGGMVYNEVFNKLYNDFYTKNGRHPNDDEIQELINTSQSAAYETAKMNMGLIYLTNKISFDNILNPRIGTRGYLASKILEWKSIGGGKFGSIGKIGYDVAAAEWKLYQRGFKNWLKGWKTDPFSKSVLNTVGYFKRNILEGIQESLQETIAYANENYYIDAYYTQPVRKNLISKAAFGPDTTPWSYYGKGLSEQFGPEGFSVFASGFAMGSLAGGLNNSMTYLMEKGAQIYDPKQYEIYSREKTKIATELVDRLNAMGFKEFADSKLFNAGTQDILASVQSDGTKKEVMDAESEALVQHMMTLYDYGILDLQLDAFESFQNMTNEEFKEAFPKIAAEDVSKYKARISDVVERGRAIKEKLDIYNKVYPNPINLDRYDKDDEDYQEAQIMHHMWNFSVKSAVFYNETFDNIRERMTKIMANHYQERPLADMTKRQSDILLRPEELRNEIGLLQNEITNLLAVDDPASKAMAKEKKKLQTAYQEYYDAYESFSNYYHRSRYYNRAKAILQKDKAEGEVVTEQEIEDYLDQELGVVTPQDEEKILLNLEEAYNKLLRSIANKPDSFMFTDKIDESFEMLMDFYKLNDESREMVDHINLLNDPEGFMDVYRRNVQWMTDLWLKRGDYYRDIVIKELGELEENGLLNFLAQQGIFMEMSDFISYRDNGIPPREFYDEKKQLVIPEGSLAYDRYFSALKLYERFKDMEVFSRAEAKKADLEMRIAQLVERREAQLLKAKQVFEENLAKTGKTLEEWEKEQPVVTGRTREQIDQEIKGLNDILYTVQNTNNVEEILGIYDALVEQGIIPDNYEDLVVEAVSANLKAAKALMKTLNDGTYAKDDVETAIQVKFTLPVIINNALEVLATEEPVAEAQSAKPLENTREWKDYQEAVAKIEERYSALIDKLKAQLPTDEEIAETKPTAGAAPVTLTRMPGKMKVTLDTPWDELPDDFRNELEAMFDAMLQKPTDQGGLGLNIEIKKTDPTRYELIRNNWYEQQGDLIDQYNSREISVEAPEFEYLELEKPVEEYSVYQLVIMRKTLESYLDRGADGNDKKLTGAEKNAIKKDIKSIIDYVDYRRSTDVPKNNKQRIFRLFEEMVVNQQNKAQRILDENGNTIGYELEGVEGRPVRVTLLSEKMEIAMTPGKEPFKYAPIEEPGKDKDGRDQGQLINLFRSIKTDTDFKSDAARLKQFMSVLTADVKKQHLKQLNSSRKLKAIEKALTNNFTEETLKAIVKSVAYDEATTAGNTVDTMVRTAFRISPDGTYEKPEKPKGMSQEAYDNLFGARGIITELQDYTLGENPKYTILSSDVMIFDPTLEVMGDTGVIGAMDLVVFDNDAKRIFIIDLKTGKPENWANFNNPKKYSKKLNYRLQQSTYRALLHNMTGELAGISILPIAITVDMEGNILTAESAAKIVNEPILRALRTQLTAAKGDPEKTKTIENRIKNQERSAIAILDPIPDKDLEKYGIVLKAPVLPENLKPEVVGKKGETVQMSVEEAKKELTKVKRNLTNTNKKINSLPNDGMIALGDKIMESPEFEALKKRREVLEKEIERLEKIINATTDTSVDKEVEEEIKTARRGAAPAPKPTSKKKMDPSIKKAIDAINNAKSLEELEDAYNDALTMILSDSELSVFAKDVEEAKNIKKKALNVSVEEDNLQPGVTYLLSKKPIFGTEENEVVVVSKVNNGKITVKQLGVKRPKTKTFTQEEIDKDFIRTTEEAINAEKEKTETVEPITPDQENKSEISKSSITEFGTNPDLINKGKEAGKLDSKSRLANLKRKKDDNNIDNCNNG